MLRVRDIMHNPVISVDRNRTLYEAAVLMERHGIGSLIVADGEKPVGILTERDFLRFAATKKVSTDSMRVGDMMSKVLMTIGSDSTVEEAGELMARHGIRRIPVMEGEKLVGIVTNRDILLKMLEGIGYESVYL